MGECRYSSSMLDLSTRWELSVLPFNFAGQFYEQTNGMAMRSPSPVITNFFMEDFKEMALD
jgi:hypothetical protein